MNPQASTTELTDLFSTAEMIFGAGLLALLMGVAMMLTGRNGAAAAGIASAVTGIVTVAVGMVWSVVDSFSEISDFWTGDFHAADDIPVIALFSSAVIGPPIVAVLLVTLLFASWVAIAVVSRRIRGDQATASI